MAKSARPTDSTDAGADLEQLAVAAFLAGRDAESAELWTRAHQEHLDAGRIEAAVRAAFWLAFGLMRSGEHARASGWLARAARLLDACGPDCVERGYLLFTDALRAIFSGENESAHAGFEECTRIAARHADADLGALAAHGLGRALIRLGRVAEGERLLDEAMAAVDAGTVSPIVAGDVYCGVIEACHEILDMRRAQEWTAALGQWCESQPGLEAYRGECMTRRAEILRFRGDWQNALAEAVRACERLSRPPRPAAGAAHYQRGELHRLRGEFDAAESEYREAAARSRKPWPGPALLRLARGDTEAAAAAIRPLLAESAPPDLRSDVLSAAVEIFTAASALDEAAAAAAELAEIAARFATPLPRALAARASGMVALARGDAAAALPALRTASAAWQELDAPWEAARTRALIGRALRALGDAIGAEAELRAAHRAFAGLGAAPAVSEMDRLLHEAVPGGLTAREVEVLRLVAEGLTNRAIGERLFISEKTVARHVANMFGKLGLSSRAAAAAWAIRHGLTA